MEQTLTQYPKFTPEMKKTHKILIPNMAPVQFRILAAVMEQAGYTCELLENCGSQVSELGMIWTIPPLSSPRPAAAAGPLIIFICCARPW